MKIALVIHTFDDFTGGKEIVTWNLANGLLKKGVHLDIVCAKYKPVNHPNINFHKVKMTGKALGINLWTFAKNALRKVKTLNADLVYTNGKAGFGDIVRIGGLPRKAHLKNTSNAITSPFKKAIYSIKKKINLSDCVSNRLEKKSLSNPSLKRVITCSDYVKKQISRIYKDVEEEKIKTVYNGFNRSPYSPEKASLNRFEIRKRFNLEKDDTVYLFAGHSFKRKGMDRLMKFVRLHPEIKLLIAGRGRKRSLAGAADRRVKWAGEVKNIDPFYDACDVLILPSISDGFGIVVTEALWRGRYVMVSENAGASEIIKDDEVGMKFSYESFPGNTPLPDYGILHSPSAVEKRRALAGSFSWEKMTGEYFNIFMDVLQAKG